MNNGTATDDEKKFRRFRFWKLKEKKDDKENKEQPTIISEKKATVSALY